MTSVSVKYSIPLLMQWLCSTGLSRYIPPVPSQPHHLAESVQELWWVMELLVFGGEEEVFMTMVPSNWMEVTPPQLMETMPQPPQESQKHNTHNTRAHLR